MTTSGSRLLAAALPVVALVVLLGSVGLALVAASGAGTLGYDVDAYLIGVRRVLDGRPLYDPTVDAFGPFGAFFYPPPFVLLALPLALLPQAATGWVFAAVLLAAFILGVAILPIPLRNRWVGLLLGGLSWPLVYAIKLGQVGPILFLLFAIGWRWMERPWRFGAAAAIGTAIKLQPILVLGWALLTRRWRALAAGLAVLAILAVAATVVVGPQAWIDQATLLGKVSKPIATPHTFTPGRLAFEAGASEALAWAVQIANWVAVGIVVLVAIRFASPVASYLAVVVASQLASPVLWDHYALILLLPVAWLLSRGRWWAVLIPLATSVPLEAVIPPVVYPLAYWVTLVAVVVEGRGEARGIPEAPGRRDTPRRHAA